MSLKRILFGTAIILATLLIIFYFNNEKHEKNTPPGRMLNYQGITFYFLDDTNQIDHNYLVSLGAVKKKVNVFPTTSFYSYDIPRNTEFFAVKNEYYKFNPSYKGVIIIKNKDNTILVGHPYFKSKQDKEEITNWINLYSY